ncbi:hypothetical protein [Neotabrizicola sp. VNH66]|uniref:hypothetical protein n=1 Tax=Neotabrizicola sp. VNH66 TaxID=3400918 RepID=UPI003C03DEE5
MTRFDHDALSAPHSQRELDSIPQSAGVGILPREGLGATVAADQAAVAERMTRGRYGLGHAIGQEDE